MTLLQETLYRATQVRELDRIAIEEFSIDGYDLMQRAGQAAFDLLRTRWPEARAILVFTGTGNNGGDGYVVARLAKQTGLDVRLIQMGDASRITGDALKARRDYEAAGGVAQDCRIDAVPEADVIVDALLGTGLEREVRDDWRTVIETINRQGSPLLAIDIPSGLHSDTGRVLGAAIRADATISFIGLKQGLFSGQAAEYCGDIVFDGLQVPGEVYARQSPSAFRVSRHNFQNHLQPRSRISHKGHFGHVLVVGGDLGMTGAVRMAAEAAARTGAGLVSVATRNAHAAAVSSGFPVAMVRGIETAAELSPLIEKATVIAVGPGMGQTQWARDLFSAILDSDRPMVVDADALNLLAREPVQRNNWILTPHPGEAARLLAVESQAVQTDRFSAVEQIQKQYGGVCILKGSGSLVRSESDTWVCSDGNPGMASGGMGDVLTGVIAGLLAQGMSCMDAAGAGVCIHASAADRAAQRGERGMLATDLFAHIRNLVNPEEAS